MFRRACLAVTFLSACAFFAHAAGIQKRDAYMDAVGTVRIKKSDLRTNLSIPQGSKLVPLPITDKADLNVFFSTEPKENLSTHAIIVIHGSVRDGDVYWSDINTFVADLINKGDKRVDPNTIVAAPEFYSTMMNERELGNKTLGWADINLWEPGEQSTHPANANISSFRAVSKLVDHFDNRTQFPSMKNITLIGHSGGGQYVNRYATVVKHMPRHSYMRFIVADPSTTLYFTDDRPVTNTSVADKATCPLYASYRYGLSNFSMKPYSTGTPQDYFRTYVTRDVVHLNGLLDTEVNGDQECMALLQGGSQRISRNLSWWKYLNAIAGTGEDTSNFPGNLTQVPNWRSQFDGDFRPRLVVVENATHDLDEILATDVGASALMSVDVLPGWRPEKPGQRADILPGSAASSGLMRGTTTVAVSLTLAVAMAGILTL